MNLRDGNIAIPKIAKYCSAEPCRSDRREFAGLEKLEPDTPINAPRHGGDIAAAERRFGRPAEGWLDLSTGINPFPYRLPDLPAALWHSLPGAELYEAALGSLRAYLGVAAACAVIAAPGTQALIQWLPHLRAPSRVAVWAPAYAEHAHCWRQAGHKVRDITDSAAEGGFAALAGDIGRGNVDVVVLVNPNNPDGHVHDPQRLEELRGLLAARGGWLIVDEAFADAVPEISLAGAARTEGLLLLRSFGKFFGLAGLRLGFALGDAALVGQLSRALGPWAVSGPALGLAARAYADHGWIATNRARLGARHAELTGLLAGHGFAPLGQVPLFTLLRTPAAGEIHEFFARRGILLRLFAEGEPRLHALRVGLPDDDGLARFAAVLTALPAAFARSGN